MNKIIKRIEEHYNITLKKIEENEEQNLQVELLSGNYYTENEKGEILKLNLSVNAIINIEILLKNSHSITHLNLSKNSIVNIEIISRFKKLKFLDLSANLISDIKPISNLKNLEILSLNDNKITKIPILKLQNLSELWLSNNQINDLPNFSNLPALRTIDLSHNEIVDIFPLLILNKLNSLTIDYNKIVNIEGLEILNNLTSISLLGNRITDISVFKKIRKLYYLNLSENIIDNVIDLKNIEIDELFIGENLIFDLSPLYNSFKNKKIKFINISGNTLVYPPNKVAASGEFQIVQWFDAVTSKANVKIENAIKDGSTKLDLGNLGLTDLGLIPKLFECIELQELILSNVYAEFNIFSKEWEPIPSKNDFLKNNIYNIPIEISKLKNLKKLILGGDWNQSEKWKNRWRITDITSITKLDNIEYINLSNNKIEDFKITRNLLKLKTIHINNNNIKSISISRVVNLEYLFASNNLIKSVDFLKKSENLKAIDLHSNLISDLYPIKHVISKIGISDSQWLYDTLSIYNNPLENPGIEVVQRGKDAVLRRMDANYGISLFKNNEIKLILVGNSEAGKTTLAKYLSGDENYKEKHPYTLWMNLMNIKFENTNLNVFDFGGHEYFHDTHHIFFTKNTMYFVVWENATDNYVLRELNQIDSNGNTLKLKTFDYPLFYWLDSIKHFVRERTPENFSNKLKSFITDDDHELEEVDKEKYDASTLVIQNKANVREDIVFLNNYNMIEKYPFIYNIINIDLHESKNLSHLNESLGSMINKVELLTGGEYPMYYKKIREKIEDLQINKSKNILTFNEFKRFCQPFRRSLTTDIEFLDIAYFLKDIGLILISKDESVFYLDLKFLSQQVIKLYEGLEKKGGILTFKEIQDKNLEYSDKVLKMIIDFNMAFEINKNSEKLFIFPLFLPIEPSKIVKLLIQNNVKPYKRITYEGFMHKGVILHIFSEYSKKIISEDIHENTYYWKNGLIVKDNDSTVLIKLFPGDKFRNGFIDLCNLSGDEVFVEKIKVDIMQINKSHNYDVKEMVTNDGENFVDLRTILENEQDKNEVFLNNDDGKYYRLSDFKKYLKNKNLGMKKVFISYSRQDLQYKDQLKVHLSILERYGLLKAWSCEEIVAGQWNHQIQTELEEADIIVYMVSANFLSSGYIMEEEVKKGIALVENNLDKKIICVVVGVCQWNNWSTLEKIHKQSNSDGNYSSMDLSKFQFLPYHQYKNEKGIIEREEIVALEKWGKHPYDVPNEAYNQIVTKIMNEMR